MLWPNGDTGTGGSPTKLAAEQAYAAQMSTQIDGLLTSILGPGKAEARVSVDLNVDKTSSDSVTYDHTNPPVVLNSSNSKETLKSNGSAPVGPAGTPSNTGTYPGASQSGGASDYNNQTDTTENGVDKTVSHTEVAPGAINQMQVALLVDKSVSASDVTAIQNAVQGMAGINPTRGDTVTVSQLAFAKPASASAAGGGMMGLGSPLGMAKTAIAGLAVLIFFFLVRKNIKRREGDPVAPEPKWLREISQSMPIAQLGSGGQSLDNPLSDRRKQTQATAEEIVRKQPDQVAMQVAQWMSE
jgi:flagellar M-ring protein FliF